MDVENPALRTAILARWDGLLSASFKTVPLGLNERRRQTERSRGL
jgi:hypothetical protein